MKIVNLYALVNLDTKEFISMISGTDDKEVIASVINYHRDIIKAIDSQEHIQSFLDKIKDIGIIRLGSLDAANIEAGISTAFEIVMPPNRKLWEDLAKLRFEIIEKEDEYGKLGKIS